MAAAGSGGDRTWSPRWSSANCSRAAARVAGAGAGGGAQRAGGGDGGEGPRQYLDRRAAAVDQDGAAGRRGQRGRGGRVQGRYLAGRHRQLEAFYVAGVGAAVDPGPDGGGAVDGAGGHDGDVVPAAGAEFDRVGELAAAALEQVEGTAAGDAEHAGLAGVGGDA